MNHSEEEKPENLPEEQPTPKDKREQGEMSLLDLMNEEARRHAGSASEAAEPADAETIDLPTDEDAIGTSTIDVPDVLPPRKIPPPIYREDMSPKTKPTERDLDATQISPRMAYPGRPQRPQGEQAEPTPADEMPTQPMQPLPRRDVPPEGTPRTSSQRPVAPLMQTGPTPQRPPTPQQRTPSPQPTVPPQTTPQRTTPPSQPLREPRPAPMRESAPQRAAPPPVRVAGGTADLPKPVSTRRGQGSSCLRRFVALAVIAALLGVVLTIVGASFSYIYIASDLPAVTELRSRASTFETARIFDRNGDLLYSLADPNAGNRTYVPINRISQNLINATISIEDARFYENPGFDPVGITRAVVQAAREREFVSGASTITQQLARALLLDEDERTSRTFSRKVREIVLAAEMFRTYEKDEILELYLNEINYGNRAYGIEAAAETYFNKAAADLTLAEASLLAGLPQAPALWDPYTAPDQAIARQKQVLDQMVAEGYITLQEAQAAINETNTWIYDMVPPNVTIEHPHFVFTVLQQLEAANDAQSIYRGGLRIFTTLDPQMQTLAEDTVTNFRGNVNNFGANNAALVSLDPRTGEILALVGSMDFNDESISGQVNMALAPRQPGSSIKPLVYLAALQQGWTPATLIWDVETQFPNGANPPYVPKNFDDEFHGPMLLRMALGNSYNVPAVKAMEFVGLCNFIQFTRSLGLTSLDPAGCTEFGVPSNYGLALALGGGEISPLEMAQAYAIIANQGRAVRPYAISRIENNRGEVLFEYAAPEVVQVVRPEHTYLISHILSDNNARQPEFGQNNLLTIGGHRVAAKTGTSGSSRFDVRDGWTIGFTPQVVTAVWIGNTDNQPIAEGGSGYQAAAPIWNSFMQNYLSSQAPVDFPQPAGVVEREICADSGTIPSASCSNRRTEVFAQDQPPLGPEADFLQRVPVDLWTGLRANEACPESVFDGTFANLLVSGRPEVIGREKALAQQWIQDTAAGRNWATNRNIALPLQLPPEQACDANTPRPVVEITSPVQFSEVSGEVEIVGSAYGPNARGYRVDFGLSHSPEGWGEVQGRQEREVRDGTLALWDTTEMPGGPAAVRVVLIGPDNPFTPEEDRVRVAAAVPVTVLEPTPTPTPTATETPTPTMTPTATSTALPSATPTATLPATATLVPSPTLEGTAAATPVGTEPPPQETAQP